MRDENCILVNIFFQIFYFQATLSSDNAQTAQRLPIRISEAKGLNPDVPNGILASLIQQLPPPFPSVQIR